MTSASAKAMLSKVPEVTLFFWVIKVLCTTVGETAADFLNVDLHLGLAGTTYVMGALLAATLVFQFMLRKYVPSVYWLAVVLISVVGTLITDNLTDKLGVSLVTTTILFAAALSVTFIAWYLKEKTLSIHSITTSRREAFYWLAILFTFALGTAFGDLIAEHFAIGYWPSALIFAGVIAIDVVAHLWLKLNAVWAFWIAYILTRPLGASLGDYLSQPHDKAGLQLGTVATTGIFLTLILGLVVILSMRRDDKSNSPEVNA